MRKEVFKDEALGSDLRDRKDRLDTDSNGHSQEEQI